MNKYQPNIHGKLKWLYTHSEIQSKILAQQKFKWK